MNSNRRDFLTAAGLVGLGAAGAAVRPALPSSGIIPPQVIGGRTAQSNMCGYAAPRIETVRVGFIGLGHRGPGAVKRMSKIAGVEITGLCDSRPERVEFVRKELEGTSHRPELFAGDQEVWKQLCARDDIDLIYIVTPWNLHTPQAVYAMESGKHVCVEVPAATTLEECWQLVETSERTRKHCMMLENCCYGYFELLTLNMARQGLFGEIVHGEGAYIHDLREDNFFKKGKSWKQWRLKENAKRNGNLYPTHGLGPVCQVMNINRGDRLDYLTSISSDDFMLGQTVAELAVNDDSYEKFLYANFRGNMNTTSIRTFRGRTIMVQHDVTTPRPYSRIHLISGTKGTARKYPQPRIAFGHNWLSKEEFRSLEERYTPEIVNRIGEMAKEVGGHGGMDFIMDWRTIDCLRNGLPLDQDVYDAALWSSIGPLSEWSVSNRSHSIEVPDFTRGAWQHNQPVDLLLENGGNTSVRL